MLLTQPRISIIMPTYNRAGLILESIRSVQKQTYSNWELLIVDDGSTDNTEELVHALKDPAIRFHKAGRIGINGRIKNIGLSMVKGEWIAFMDSDDLWAETKLEKQMMVLHQNPEASFSFTGGFNFKEFYRPIDFFYKKSTGIFCGDIFLSIFKSEISATTPSLLFNRECLENVKGFDESKPFSDIDFILRLAHQYKAVILYEPLLYRRIHDKNDSGTDWVKGYRQGIELIRQYSREISSSIKNDALFKLYVNFGEDRLVHSQRIKAMGCFIKAWSLKPHSSIPARKFIKSIIHLIVQKKRVIDVPGSEPIKSRPLPPGTKVKRILAIRLQAMGDLAAALPYLQQLRNSLPPSTRIDLLTRVEVASLPKSLLLFNNVFTIGGGRSIRKQFLRTVLKLPRLMIGNYDLVIDLQNNTISRLVRKSLFFSAWSSYDRYSPISGGERYRLTIEASGIGKSIPATKFHLKVPGNAADILKQNGWEEKNDLVVLNPAAAFETRNWNIENYVHFAKLWINIYPETQFLLLGTSFIHDKANYLKEQLGSRLINLESKTSVSEAFSILQRVKFILSEDSGLMHMAWASGIPTLALFGATRTDQVQPIGDHTFFLDASDLPCGGCMKEICMFGNVHCLARYTPEFVFQKAMVLMEAQNSISKSNTELERSVKNVFRYQEKD